jgi:hypothetical protein
MRTTYWHSPRRSASGAQPKLLLEPVKTAGVSKRRKSAKLDNYSGPARLRPLPPQPNLGGSSNGRTPDSGSGYQGSNPCPPATCAYQMRCSLHFKRGKRTFLFLTAVSPCLGGYPLSKWPRPHRLAVRTPASHVGNTGSSPVGVTPDFACETRSAAAKTHRRSSLRRWAFRVSGSGVPTCVRASV